MMYASKVEFTDRPAVAIGDRVSGQTVDKIEVRHEEFEDHSEMIILVYNGKTLVQKFWDFPCCITFLLPTKGDPV